VDGAVLQTHSGAIGEQNLSIVLQRIGPALTSTRIERKCDSVALTVEENRTSWLSNHSVLTRVSSDDVVLTVLAASVRAALTVPLSSAS
jgi:hypothetical protein